MLCLQAATNNATDSAFNRECCKESENSGKVETFLSEVMKWNYLSKDVAGSPIIFNTAAVFIAAASADIRGATAEYTWNLFCPNTQDVTILLASNNLVVKVTWRWVDLTASTPHVSDSAPLLLCVSISSLKLTNTHIRLHLLQPSVCLFVWTDTNCDRSSPSSLFLSLAAVPTRGSNLNIHDAPIPRASARLQLDTHTHTHTHTLLLSC